jgi:hypothetical protein
MSDREFGGNDDLSLPKGMHTERDSAFSRQLTALQQPYRRLSRTS